jgi:hypothetical protein
MRLAALSAKLNATESSTLFATGLMSLENPVVRIAGKSRRPLVGEVFP